MKKNLILYILLVFLIAANVFFLYLYMGKSDDSVPSMPERNQNFIVKELGFNENQLKQFNEKSKGHFETMKGLSNEIKELKDNLFGTLSDDLVNEATIDSISALICEIETKKEKEIYYHFKMIRDIADDEQKGKFEGILLDALRQGDKGNRPPPPNGQDDQRPRPPHPPKNK